VPSSCDLLVIGAGPAGIAAALQGRAMGLEVRLLERRGSPGLVPGETLHPGIEPVLDRLGLGAVVRAAGFVRQEGIVVQWDGPAVFQPYGSDKGGAWRGFQAERRRFGAILWQAAREAGAMIEAGCGPVAPILDQGRVAGVRRAGEMLRARWTLDATGRAASLAEAVGLTAAPCSPPLFARFGWADGPGRLTHPQLTATGDGWRWQAPIEIGRLAWARLSIGAGRGGLDLRWRRRTAATPGLLMVGDAAALLDPASSHGVLRALMTGMMAAHLAGREIGGGLGEREAIARYDQWLRNWFEHDARALRDLYRRHPSALVRRAFGAPHHSPARPARGDRPGSQSAPRGAAHVRSDTVRVPHRRHDPRDGARDFA
jgi:flavin-dependent dehydrogenase